MDRSIRYTFITLLFFLLSMGMAAMPLVNPSDTTKAAKKAAKALKMMESKDAAEWNKGFTLYQQSAEMGLPSAQKALVTYYLNQNPKQENNAIMWAKRLAETGDVDCQYLLGYIYLGLDSTYSTSHNEILGCRYMRMAAEQNDGNAQYFYACCLKDGIGTIKDNRKAEKYFLLSAEQNNALAQETLGELYYNGDGFSVDKSKAFYYTKKAAENDMPQSMYNLGTLYLGHDFVEKDIDEAIYWLTKASDRGVKEAKNNLALALEEKNGVSGNISYMLTKAAEDGDNVALYNLGNRYSNGEGVQADSVMAISLYRKSAENGYAPSQRQLGIAYLNGEGVKQDPVEGFKWMTLAAEQNDTIALYNIGWCYENGVGTDRHPEKAFKYYKKAANFGFPEALSGMAVCYYNGIGTEQSYQEAFQYAKKAAQANVARGWVILASMYVLGVYVEKDYSKAMDYYNKALALDFDDKGYLWACMGYVQLLLGKNTQAIDFYSKSANYGSALGQFYLAIIYYDGKITRRNIVKARALLGKCAKQDYNLEIQKKAKEILSKMK